MALFAPVKPPEAKPLPYGLINSVTLVTDDPDDRWVSGYAFGNELCRVGIRNMDVCDTDNVDEVHASGGTDIIEVTPFVIQAEDNCSTFGLSVDERRARVKKQLEACTPKALEYELWTGGLMGNVNQRLTGGTVPAEDLTPAGGPVNAKIGLSILEQALADCSCGLTGTIHVTRGIASSLISLVEKASAIDDVLYTALGNMLVVGSGYIGSDPDGGAAASGSAWMYATGPVSVRLGEIYVVPDDTSQAVDREINKFGLKAERFASAAWTGCCLYGVHVTP